MNYARTLLLPLITAVAALAAAVTLVVTAPDRSEPPAPRSHPAPGAVWTLDAAEVLGSEFATFRDPTRSGHGGIPVGFIDAGDTLVTEIGVQNYETSTFDRTALVGINSATGDVRWKSPVAAADVCSSELFGGKLLCHNESDIVVIGPSDGSVSRYPTEWHIFGVETDGTDVYVVEGVQDAYSVTLHRGTLDDPDSGWSRTLDDTYVGPSEPGRLLSFSDGVGVTNQLSRTVLFDTATGEVRDEIADQDCMRGTNERNGTLILVVSRRCTEPSGMRTELMDVHGRILAATDGEIYQRTLVDEPISPQAPMMLGQSAFDPENGQRIWTTENFFFQSDVAIVGNVVLAQSSQGLDLNTGEPMWDPSVDVLHGMPDVVHDGTVYVTDGTDVYAVDPVTGRHESTVSVTGLLGQDFVGYGNVGLQDSRHGVVVLGESRLNLVG